MFVNQLSATVWPYLSFTMTENDTLARYSVENDGLGPAILRAATLSFDGTRLTAMRDIGERLKFRQPRHSTLRSSSLNPGEVLRPGFSATAFEYDGAGARALADGLRKRVVLSICYCSLLDQCWVATSSSGGSAPTPVRSCPKGEDLNA